VFAPFDAIVERNTTVYTDTNRWKGIVLRGINEYTGLEVKIFYMTPMVAAKSIVARGQYIGDGQAISQRFSPEMIDHIHFELRKNVIDGVKNSGQLVDPFDYIFSTV